MRWFSSTPRNRDRDLNREVAFHIDALARDYEAVGMSAEEARRKARIDFGGREQVTQQLREVHISALLEAARANVRAAFRFLRKAPGLSAAVILTLALGIGANTAVFSAIDAVILRPLPFPQGDQLMTIEQHDTKGKSPVTFVAPTRLEDWNRLNHTFQAITGYYTEDESETSGSLPERLENAIVAPRFLQVFGIAPQLGRDFSPAEEHYGGPRRHAHQQSPLAPPLPCRSRCDRPPAPLRHAHCLYRRRPARQLSLLQLAMWISSSPDLPTRLSHRTAPPPGTTSSAACGPA